MTQLLAAIAELLGVAAFSATAAKQEPAQPVSSAVAALVAAMLGAVVGGPAALAIPALPALVTIGLTLGTLVLLTAALRALGAPFGASSSWRASLVYAAAFNLGAFGLLWLFSG